ncbi:unnamed protein product [marine sediment metagenome]|uniref:Methyltransferase domain-containing protein n=1 Tax=marine sediment metagenome TaxID=412755 RepID=X0W5K8_9ZZZZ
MTYIERPASFYDKSWKEGGWKLPELIPRHDYAIAELKRLGVKTILDIGCGVGEFLSLCQDRDFICYGFDFSSVAIEICMRRNGLENVWIGNALDKKNYVGKYDAYLAIEVLEHITQDLDVIGNLKPNIPFIFSLPCWATPDGSHVRCFRSDAEIMQRYEKVVDIKSIKRFGTRRVVIASTIKRKSK